MAEPQETIVPGELTLAQLARLCANPETAVVLDPACRAGIRASADIVRRASEGDQPVYGVNTGFGKLATQRIARVRHTSPAPGGMRHADAGYQIAVDCAREQGLDLPMLRD